MNVTNHFRSLILISQVVAFLYLASPLGAAGPLDELEAMVEEAFALNPRIEAARLRLDQLLARHEATLAFFDPQLYGAASVAQRARGVPGSTAAGAIGNDANVFQGGVEMPLQPGAYLSIGAAERYLREPGLDFGGLYQTLLGARLRIPLLRDRGFQQWTLVQTQALMQCHIAGDQLLLLMQQLRHDIELAYIAAQERSANYNVAREATQRFQSLLDEARELVHLKVVPEYQVFTALMEVELQREAELSARQALDVSLMRLGELIGDGREVTLADSATPLGNFAEDSVRLPDYPLRHSFENRGDYRQIVNEIALAEAAVLAAEDELRSDLSLTVGTTWQGENPRNPAGHRTLLSDRHLGSEVVLVWQRPFRRRGERSRLKERQARLAELYENLQTVELQIRTDLAVAASEFTAARARLGLASSATAAAQQALEAEQERFRLGTARSRNVLDAQKDLTVTKQRQTSSAADLLRARSNYFFATGYADRTVAMPTLSRSAHRE